MNTWEPMTKMIETDGAIPVTKVRNGEVFCKTKDLTGAETDYLKLDDHFFVDLRGNMKDPESMIGSCTKRVTELFETKEEAIAYYEKEEKKEIFSSVNLICRLKLQMDHMLCGCRQSEMSWQKTGTTSGKK